MRGRKPLTLAKIRRTGVAFNRERAKLKTLVEMPLVIAQGDEPGAQIWLTLDGSALVDDLYTAGWLFGKDKPAPGRMIFLTGVYRKPGRSDPQRPVMIQVCEDGSLTWGACASAVALYPVDTVDTAS